jgi:hypothetical protein
MSMNVLNDGSIWILPNKAGEGRLWEYRNGGFVAEHAFHVLPGDFLVMPEGIYSWARSARVGLAGHFAFDPVPGDDEAVFVDLPEAVGISRSAWGRLQEVSSGPALVGLDWQPSLDPSLSVVLQPRVFAIELGAGLSRSPYSHQDVNWGVPTSEGSVWKDALLIRRGEEVVLDLGPEDGSLEHVFSSGGFVVRRGGGGGPTFEIYDARGALVRTVVTLSHTASFGVATSPWIFGSNAEVYQLRLGDDGGRVLRY